MVGGEGMTITKYDRVAILPKRCDKCNRLFWLEPYNIFYKTVGIGDYSIKQIECKNCAESKKPSLLWECRRCGKLMPYMVDFCSECAEKLLGEPPKPIDPPESEEN